MSHNRSSSRCNLFYCCHDDSITRHPSLPLTPHTLSPLVSWSLQSAKRCKLVRDDATRRHLVAWLQAHIEPLLDLAWKQSAQRASPARCLGRQTPMVIRLTGPSARGLWCRLVSVDRQQLPQQYHTDLLVEENYVYWHRYLASTWHTTVEK